MSKNIRKVVSVQVHDAANVVECEREQKFHVQFTFRQRSQALSGVKFRGRNTMSRPMVSEHWNFIGANVNRVN